MNLDFAKIRDYPITDVASMLGLTLEERGEQLVGTCPISKANNATAFKITPSKNRFICFCSACKKLDKPGGDCIELVRRVRGMTNPRDAAQEIVAHFNKAGKAVDNPPPRQEVSPSKQSGFDPLAYLETLALMHDEIDYLGISPQTFRDFKAGYCSKGLNRGRLAVAICNANGEIMSFVGVPLKGDDGLLFPKGTQTPFYMGVQLVGEGELHLFDGILQAMEAYENGIRSLLILLRPITADTLKCLYALMAERNCTTLEICY